MKTVFLLIMSMFAMSVSAEQYQVGQVWEYKTRSNEMSSLLYIVRIDANEKLGDIYHIYIDGLGIKNPHTESGIQNVLPHVPVDINTLELSVTKIVKTSSQLPDISGGYQTWKQAFDAGEGGVFNISVQQIIEYIEDIIGKNA